MASVALTMFYAMAALLVPRALKSVVDHVLEKRPLPPALAWVAGDIGTRPLGLLLLAVASGLGVVLAINTLHVLSNFVNTRIDQYITLDFRSSLFSHAQRMS